MANNYTDHAELRFELNHPLMKRIVELKERNFRDKDEYDYAPLDFDDAMDNYDRVLDITGELAGTTIADNAEGVDLEGPHHEGDRVHYASGTAANLDAMVKAGLNGMTMPRRFGGLNFPITPYTMCAMPDLATSGVCRIVLRHFTSLATRTSTAVSFRASAQAKPCRWTLPSPTPVRTFST